MDGLGLKPQFDRIQRIFNRCIGRTYQVLADRIAVKSAYLDCEQMRELERLEYIRTVRHPELLLRSCLSLGKQFLRGIESR